MIVDDPLIARYVCDHGVSRLFVDLEVLGKAKRQSGMDTWKSAQTIQDVTKIREAAPDSHLMVRINPLNENSNKEIDEVVARGCQSIMLPMFRDKATVQKFFDLVRDRAICIPLAETKSALDAIPEIAEELPLDYLHIGLNDLHLDLGNDFMFEPIANGVLEAPCEVLRKKGVKFGIGGIARAREGIVSPEYLLGEHVRLGSTAAILSRSFHRGAKSLHALLAEMDFRAEVQKLMDIYSKFQIMDSQSLEKNRVDIRNRVSDVVSLIRKKKL
jgi:hypothetical protein